MALDSFVVLVVVAPVLLFALCVGTSALLAQKRDAQLNERAPETLSYKWGYFQGYYGIIGGVVVIAVGAVLMSYGLYREWIPWVQAHALAFGIASYGVLLRRKWGWVLQIPLSLNMGLWAFNSVYVSNRWREFS